MSDYIEGLHFNEGFHGTDIDTAWNLVLNGFDIGRGETCFATPDQLYLARGHGEKNARRQGLGAYAVLKVSIPRSTLQESYLGPPCIRLTDNQVGDANITAVDIYSRDDNLIAKIPLDEDV